MGRDGRWKEMEGTLREDVGKVGGEGGDVAVEEELELFEIGVGAHVFDMSRYDRRQRRVNRLKPYMTL